MTQSGSIAMLLWTWLLEPVDQPVAGLPPWTPIEPPAPEPAPAAGAPASLPTPAASEVMPAETAPPRRRRFVFAWMTGLTFGVSRWLIPSFSGAAFFGGRLRRERWALGVMVTGTFGMADRYWLGLLGVRLHFAAVHRFGAFGFASIGAGVASFFWYPAVAEIETRVGTALGPRKRLLLGGQVRLGVDFFYREKVPLPQLGIFTGMSFL